MLARSKLNNMKSIRSKVLKDSKITHEDFTTIISEEQNYRRLKDIRMRSGKSDTEKRTDWRRQNNWNQ